jgi:tetratricopeptide (TPR) repeat protein
MVFEDVHWADPGVLDFIEHLLDWSAKRPIFMLALTRPELTGPDRGWPSSRRGVTLIDLEPLTEPTMSELLDELAELPARAREQIMITAQGVPPFAVEMIRAMTDQGALTQRDDGRLVLSGELGELKVPASLSSLLTARLDGLAPTERELVKAMSVFGGAFPRQAAAALTGVADDELDRTLGGVVGKQVLVIGADPLSPDQGQYAFSHALLRTVAYETLARRERKARHLAAAQHLRDTFPNDGDEIAEVIAAHYLDAHIAAGNDPDEPQLRELAVNAFRRAGEHAAVTGAPKTAQRAYRTAMSLASDEHEHVELTARAGEMALQAGDYETALEQLQAASDAHRHAGRDEPAARMAYQIGAAYERLGRIQESIDGASSALDVLGADRLDADVARLNANIGSSLIYGGHLLEAGSRLGAASRAAEALQLTELTTEVLTLRASLCMFENRWEEARILFDGAIALAEHHAQGANQALAYGNSGNLRMCRDMPGAVEHYDSSLTASRQRGDRGPESWAASGIMYVHQLTGDWDAIEQLAAELFESGGEQRPEAERLHCRLAVMYTARGETARARDSLERLDAYKHTEILEYRAARDAVLVRILLAEDRCEEALARGQVALDQAVATLGVSNETARDTWPETLDAALRVGQLDTAGELLQMLADLPPGHVPPYLRAQLVRGRALFNRLSGQHDAVEPDLHTAVEQFDTLGYPYWHALAQADLAAWQLDHGPSTTTIGLLEQAAATLQRLGARPALSRTQQLLTRASATVSTA